FVGVLTEMPPWEVAFWKTQGPRLGVALIVSLSVLAAAYVVSEFYLFASERAIARRNALRLWYRRWLGRSGFATDETARLRAVGRSPLFRMLPPPTQREIAKALKPQTVRPWKQLLLSNASLILS